MITPRLAAVGKRLCRAAVCMFAVLGIVTSLVVGVLWAAVELPSVRSQLAVKLSGLLSSELRGSLRIGAIERLGAFTSLTDVTVWDPHGKVVLRVARVEATVNLRALLRGDVILERIVVERPWLSLHAQGPSLAIAEAFEPAQPAPPGAQPSAFVFAIGRGALKQAMVVSAPGGIALSRLDARFSLSHTGALRVQVEDLSARLLRGAARADLTVRRSSLRLGVGDRSRFDVTVAVADDRARVTGELGWDGQGVRDGRATLEAAVSPAGLTALGEREAAHLLAGPVALHGSAALAEHGADLTMHVELVSPAGHVGVEAARHGDLYRVRVHSSRLVLAKLCTLEGLGEAAFDVSATGTEGPTGQFAVSMASRDLRYDELRIPPWRAQLDVSPEGLRLLSLSIPEWTPRRGKIDVALEVARSGALRGTADLQLADVALQPAGLGIARLQARARVHGSVSRPTLSLELSARRLRVADLALDRVEASVQGGPRDYRITLFARQGRLSVENHYRVELEEDAQTVRGRTVLTGLEHGVVELTVPRARVRAGALELQMLRARRGTSQVTVSGRYAFSGTSTLHVQVTNLALSELMDDLAVRPSLSLAGRLSALVDVEGTAEQPRFSSELELSNLQVNGQRVGKLRAEARLDSAAGALAAKVEYAGPQGDAAHLAVRGVLDRHGHVAERIADGAYVVSVSIRQSLGHLGPLWRSLGFDPALDGVVLAEGRFAGNLQRPEGGLNLKVYHLTLSGVSAVDAELGVELGAQRTWAGLRARDAAGTRATAVVDVRLGASELARDLTLARLVETNAQVTLDLRVPRLDHLPAGANANLPVQLEAQASLTTSTRAPPRADVSARAVWKGQTPHEASAAAPTELTLAASLQSANLRMDVEGALLGRRVVRASLGGHAPVGEWMHSDVFRGDLSLVLDVADLDLASLPVQLEGVSGWVFGNFRAEGLLTPAPRVETNLRLTRFALASSDPSEVELVARADARGGSLDLTTRVQDHAALHVWAQLPWQWNGERKLEPALPRFQARAQVDDMPLSVLLGALPQVANPRGTMTGHLAIDGLPHGYDARGQLAIEGAGFTLTHPLIRFENVDANLRLDRSGLELEHFRWVDQEGVLSGRAKVQLQGLAPTAAQATFSAKNVPVRRDTLVVAVVDGSVELRAELGGARRHARVTLRDVAVRLPDQGAHRAQPLEPNADVVYTDALAAEIDTRDAAAPPTPLDIEIDASQPFWVRHSDFALQLGAKLKVRSEGEASYLSGPVRILRGFLNLLGKGFDLQRGLVVFDGGEQVDPTLTIDAVHKLADGHTVTVMARGRASAPELTFTSTVPGVTGSAEALQLLVRGRDNSAAETAQAQMGAALAGLTAGFLSKLTRNKYGKYVPVLSLEAGASSGTRVRAGVEANELIPPFLRSTVQGVYVEGFVGSQNQGGSRQSAGGVLVELYFPEDIVTGGTWELPNNWSIEATWEP